MKTIAKATLLLMVGLTGCSSSSAVAQQVVNVQPASPVSKPMNQIQRLILDYKRKEIRRVAFSGLGVPYVFSGASRYGWDCSGFTAYVYGLFGIQLEHSATKQAFVGKRVAKPSIGDLVLFSYGSKDYFYHASIYVGDNKVIDANAYYGRTVVEPLNNYKGNYKVYVQVIR